MEEERRRGKEYYQVNLDMGRLFWIAFILGLFIIGIFIVGFWVGGGRGEKKREFPALSRTELFKREKALETTEDETSKIKELFENNLETETRYIDVKTVEKPVVEKGKPEKTYVPAPEKPPLVTISEKPYVPPAIKQEKVVTPPVVPSLPKDVYYIQVASFTKRENALSMAERLKKNLYKVVIEEAVVNEQVYYRVRVGPFESRNVANNTMLAMKRRFDLENPFVLKKES
jgi:cell division septation protein DedD